MRCCLKFGGIIQFWHSFLVVTFQSSVLLRGIFRYLALRSQVFDSRHGLDWDMTPLHFYVNCIVLSSAFTLLMAFLLCSCQDYFILRQLSVNSPQLFSISHDSLLLENSGFQTNSLSPTKKKGINCPQRYPFTSFPLAFIFHVIAAYFLLLPSPWVIGEQAKNEAINPNFVWRTDLSFVFPALSPKDLMKNTRLRHPDFATKLVSSGIISTRLSGSDLLAVQPPTLGGIGQLPQTKQQESAIEDLKSAILQHSSGIRTAYTESASASGMDVFTGFSSPSPEFINYFAALSFLAVRIAMTFWSIWPTFSLLTSVILMLTGVYLTFEYTAVSLLVQLSSCLTSPSNSSNVYGALIMVRLPMKLTPWLMILLTAAGCFVTLSSYGILFHLGMRQFYKVMRKNYYTLANIRRLSKRSENGASESNFAPSLGSDENSTQGGKCCSKWNSRAFYDRFNIVIGFVSLVASILVRVPCTYDICLLFWNEKDYLCLTTAVLFIFLHLAWLMMWFGFAMKQKWSFQLKYPKMISKNTEPDFQNTFMMETTRKGLSAFSPIPQCDEEPHQSFTSSTLFNPLHLPNPSIAGNHSPFHTPSSKPSLLPNMSCQPLCIPASIDIMTNKLYESNHSGFSLGNEPIPMQSPYLLPPGAQKYASIRRPNLWDPENAFGKQKVIVNVTEDSSASQTPREPMNAPSCSSRAGDTRPQSVTVQPMEECFGPSGTLLKATSMALQASSHSTASSNDQICSQV